MRKYNISQFLIIMIIIMTSCSPEQKLPEFSSKPDNLQLSSFTEGHSNTGDADDNSLAGELLKARQYIEEKDYAKAIEIYESIPFSYSYNDSEGAEIYAGLFEAYLNLQKFDLARESLQRGYDFLENSFVESSMDRLNKQESENIFYQTGNYSTQNTLTVIDTSVPPDQREWKSWVLNGGDKSVTDNTFLWLAYWACTERGTFPQREEGPLSVVLRDRIENLPIIGSVQRNVVQNDVWYATEEFIINLTGEVKPDIDFFYSVARSLGEINYWVQDSRRSTKVSFLLNGKPYPGIPIRDDGGIAHIIGTYTKEEFDSIRSQNPYFAKPVEHKEYAESNPKVFSTTEEIREMWEMLLTPEEFEILYPMCIHTGQPEKDKLLDFLNAYLELDSSTPHEYINGVMDDGLFRCVLSAAPFIPEDSEFAEILKQNTHTSDAYYMTKEDVDATAKRLFGENVAFIHHSLDGKDWSFDSDLEIYSPFRAGGGNHIYFWRIVSYIKNENNEYIIEALSTRTTDPLSSMNEETLERIRGLGNLPPEVRITLQQNDDKLSIKRYEYLLNP